MERIDDILEIHRTIQQVGLGLGVGWYLTFTSALSWPSWSPVQRNSGFCPTHLPHPDKPCPDSLLGARVL